MENKVEKVRVILKRNIIGIVDMPGKLSGTQRLAIKAGSEYDMTPGELLPEYYTLLEDVQNEEIKKATETLERAKKEADFFNSRREELERQKQEQLKGLAVQAEKNKIKLEQENEVHKKRVKK